jgi:glycosyltransferase involved in cell wall biosynthesis
LKIAFVSISKRLYRPGWRKDGDGRVSHDQQEQLRGTLLASDWGDELLRGLERRGHRTAYIRLEPDVFLRAEYGSDAPIPFDAGFDLDTFLSPTLEAVWERISDYDALILRKHHRIYRELLAPVDTSDMTVLNVPTNPCPRRLEFTPRCRKFVMMVNDPEEAARISKVTIAHILTMSRRPDTVTIFRKPAAPRFYGTPSKVPRKQYDVIYVPSHLLTEKSAERKRLQLFLGALDHLNALKSRKFIAILVGDPGIFADELSRRHDGWANVDLICAGYVPPEALCRLFHSSRLHVVTSRRDANPRTIVEGMACNVPVAVPSDITGGKFQVTPSTGEIYDPNPDSLAVTIANMLETIDRYQPKAHCVTIEEAVDQIESLIV